MESYFTPESAMHRFFYIQGMTSDDFYTESGMNVDLEWLLFRELKKRGYERVIYYDKALKLYCYDDVSFELMRRGGRRKTKESSSSLEGAKTRPSGLKKGKWDKKARGVKSEQKAEQSSRTAGNLPEDRKNDEYSSGEIWVAGEASGIRMKGTADTPLHGGMQDIETVYRQIDACMTDGTIKTAVVINDADDFIRELGVNRQHNISAYMRLPASNVNIMIFIYPDQKMLSLLDIHKLDMTEMENAPNVIEICSPNALEIYNMLNYFRLSSDLEYGGRKVNLKLRVSEMLDIALEMKRCMDEGKGIRIKELYHKLLRFSAEGRTLTKENCCRIFGREKHLTGEEQMNRLIGMQNVKDALERYKGRSTESEEKVRYLTSSRILPDLPVQGREDLMHVMLTGNPGTGKTTVAKLLGQIYFEMGYLASGHVVETDREGLVGGYIGQTAIKTKRKIMEAMGGVLFIDEAYSLKRTDDDSHDFGQEAIDTLIKAMDEYKGQFIVVAAGYEKEMENFINSNPGLLSRIRTRIHIEDYEPGEMRQILELYVKERGFRFSEELNEKLDDFCENWVNLAGENWGNAREAVNLSADLQLAWEKDPDGRSENIDGTVCGILEERHIPEELREYLQPVSKMREKVIEELNAMTGLAPVKEQLETLRLRLLMGEADTPRHYIFIGNPGTGKSTVARLMGRIMRNHGMLKRGHIVEYTAGDLVNAVSRGKSFSEIASKALDGVLFIDEAYQLADTHTGRRIINELVPFMENHHDRISVICAGYEEDMEKFLDENAGLKDRFSERILFPSYTGEELQEILIKALEKKGYQVDDDYKEYSLRALTRYVDIHGREKDFGNARYVREKYIPQSLDARNRRLFQKYGENIPEDEKHLLTGEDIPEALIKYTKEKLPEPDKRTAMEKIEDLIGYAQIKEELKRLLRSAVYRQADGSGAQFVPETLHWVLMGNPGTGKTTIAKLVGQVYKECGLLSKGHLVKATRSDLVAGYEGQTASKTRRMIEKAMDGILFIDEAYSLVKGAGQGGGFGTEAIAELVEAMSDRNGEFAVIAAGYPDDMEEFLKNNSGLRSRFKVFVLEDYTPAELHQILTLKCREANFKLAPQLDEKLDLFFSNYKGRESKRRTWANGREAENLLRSMQHEWFANPVIEEDPDGRKHRILTELHMPKELLRYLKGRKMEDRNKESAQESIRMMTGFDEIKKHLEDLLILGQRSRQEGMEDLLDGLTLHWILEGNPGTGKTMIAKLIGKAYKEIGLLERGHCVKVTRADLVGQYVGETAQKTRKCIERAMGGVLFIDEAYTLKRTEITTGHDYGQEAIDEILEAMSDKNGEFAVIAAGYPREMEVFLNSNPGFRSRFNDNIFRLKDYTAQEMAEIFRSVCRRNGFTVGEDLQKVLVPLFESMISSGRKGWANGREAENLEKQMRVIWSRSPVFTQEEEARIRVYARQHLPESYEKYLDQNRKQEKTETESIAEKEEKRIPAAVLPSPAEEFDYEKDFAEQEQGLVFIRASVGGGSGFSCGSGFLLTQDGCIITCRHVVENAESVKVRLRIPGRSGGDVSWHAARILKLSKETDLALLKIDVLRYPALPMRPATVETEIGEAIYHMGYPFGTALSDNADELRPSLFQGHVSSIQTKQGHVRINTDMAAKRGCSGGPVFSRKDGTVIGILCGSQTQGEDGLTEEINFVLPAGYIWEEMTEKTPGTRKEEASE